MNTNLSNPSLFKNLEKCKSFMPTVLIIFGASGDLSNRKLLPAIYNLFLDNTLPLNFYLIGFGRKNLSNKIFKKNIILNITKFSRRSYNANIWENIENRISYMKGQYEELNSFYNIEKEIIKIEKNIHNNVQIIFYISTPPETFKKIINNIGNSGLAFRNKNKNILTKIIIEKPFGKDLNSARELNKQLDFYFDESQVFRIDHYLGKKTVQELLFQRFSDPVFEKIWNSKFIEYIQITISESIGVESRSGYYDKNGALRDMIQNHAMQLLSLIAMEHPQSLSAENISNEKVKLLKSIQPLIYKINGGDIIRAQYKKGVINGKIVPGYLSELNIDQNSFTETYAAIRVLINNCRWKGVPFYLRSGKRMPKNFSEIKIKFKDSTDQFLKSLFSSSLNLDSMFIKIQPNIGKTFLLSSKISHFKYLTKPIYIKNEYPLEFKINLLEAYERLLIDAIIGDKTLFVRRDETEESWKIFTPVLNFWEEIGIQGLYYYDAGSWGPIASQKFFPDHIK